MSTPSSAASTSTPVPGKFQQIAQYLKPWLTPYYLTVAAVLGGITAVFAVVTVLLIIVVANFNVLGWME